MSEAIPGYYQSCRFNRILQMKLPVFEVHAVANSVEEAKKLVEAGFEYVCGDENVMFFGERK